MIEACAGRVDVLAHSYGGLVALEAALLDLPIDRRTEQAAETLLVERAGVPDDELTAARELPLWPIILEGIEVLPREGRAAADYRFQPERFAELEHPTLVLAGEQNPARVHEAMRALDGALPRSELRALAGQGHQAAQTAPNLLAAEIHGFWSGR